MTANAGARNDRIQRDKEPLRRRRRRSGAWQIAPYDWQEGGWGPAEPSSGFQLTAAPIALANGGGAIRGSGKTFASSLVVGTASMSMTLDRGGCSGLRPELNLSRDVLPGRGSAAVTEELQIELGVVRVRTYAARREGGPPGGVACFSVG
jgi:hypothetical protein